MMPKLDGLQACMRIREFSNVPIIMLTARGEDVSGTGSCVGGVVGYVDISVISDCYNTGVVNGTDYVGGVVGRSDLDFETEIYSCYYLVGTATGGINGKDSEGDYDTTYAINASDFASENMANLLNGSVGEYWEYIIGEPAPTLKAFN